MMSAEKKKKKKKKQTNKLTNLEIQLLLKGVIC